MKGPFTIMCRNHSGSRMLCEAFRQNGFWMGLSEDEARDAEEFAQQRPEIRHLVQEAFRYSTLAPDERQGLQRLMRKLVEESKGNCPDPEARVAYGWKRIITTFTVEIFLDAYPQGKAVHLIRDGRDVMLTRAKYKMARLKDPFNALVVFGDAGVSTYRGQPLTPEVIAAYRNELEMRYWVTMVEFGRRGRSYPDQYLEVFYEDLCRQPVGTLEKVFDFLEVEFCSSAREWARRNAHTKSIGKWQRVGSAELQDAVAIGKPLLRELDYL